MPPARWRAVYWYAVHSLVTCLKSSLAPASSVLIQTQGKQIETLREVGLAGPATQRSLASIHYRASHSLPPCFLEVSQSGLTELLPSFCSAFAPAKITIH